MNIVVILAIIAGLIALRFLKLNALMWSAATMVASYLLMRYGIEPPVPASVRSMFLFIIALALAAYISTTDDRLQETKRAFIRFFADKKLTVPLVIALIGLPVLVAFQVYTSITNAPAPPVAGRTIHPPPPATISFQGKQIDLAADDNPYRDLENSDPAAFTRHVENGRRIYYENCVNCHGDNMEGDGVFAHGFDPIPANFQDATTIAMLQETYLFWRIAKGGPGLPIESTPWSSAMPAWETFLSEEEIWDVILFLYEFTDQRPRAKEEH